jgi:8-oxo-dGTP pyrophosphatase MutT (NUDIX family)
MENVFRKKLSCGLVILNHEAELLLCHVTGHDHWDLPKGGIDAGETPLQAALRETREETGLRLHAETLLDLGRLAYRPKKDLHLFAALLPRIDTSRLVCESHFSHAVTGQRLPEMDAFGWFPWARVPELCSRRLAQVLQERLDLPQLLDRLRHPEAPPLLPV